MQLMQINSQTQIGLIELGIFIGHQTSANIEKTSSANKKPFRQFSHWQCFGITHSRVIFGFTVKVNSIKLFVRNYFFLKSNGVPAQTILTLHTYIISQTHQWDMVFELLINKRLYLVKKNIIDQSKNQYEFSNWTIL